MNNKLKPTALTCALALLSSLPGWGQNQPTTAPSTAPMAWTLSATAQEESVGHGLPVLALDRPDWPSHRSDPVDMARAMRSLRAELSATHPSGWRLGVLARAEAWLQASADAVTVAALDATQADPSAPRSFSLAARSQSWQGQGIRLGTPWWPIHTAPQWQWQADVQLLRLQRLRVDEVAGDLRYGGAGVYDFNLHSQRSNTSITDAYLPPSGSAGLGASLSLALKAAPAPGWQLQLRADDLFSKLAWSELATETAVLGSQVTSRAADGSLDYAPLINGKNALLSVSKRIGVHWLAQVNWAAWESSGQAGTLTLRTERKAGLNQFWFGWDSAELAHAKLRWQVEIEPELQAVSIGLVWHDWHALLATDGKGLGSQLRSINLGWQASF